MLFEGEGLGVPYLPRMTCYPILLTRNLYLITETCIFQLEGAQAQVSDHLTVKVRTEVRLPHPPRRALSLSNREGPGGLRWFSSQVDVQFMLHAYTSAHFLWCLD